MGFYQLGARVAPKPLYRTHYAVGGFEFWRGVKTPGQIRDEVNRIDAQVKATGGEIFKRMENGGAFPPNLKDVSPAIAPLATYHELVWSPFVRAWQEFAAHHQDWTSNVWGDTWDEVQTYQRELVRIRDGARALGMDFKSPDPTIQNPSGFEDLASKIWSVVKLIVYVGLGLISVGLLVHLLGR